MGLFKERQPQNFPNARSQGQLLLIRNATAASERPLFSGVSGQAAKNQIDSVLLVTLKQGVGGQPAFRSEWTRGVRSWRSPRCPPELFPPRCFRRLPARSRRRRLLLQCHDRLLKSTPSRSRLRALTRRDIAWLWPGASPFACRKLLPLRPGEPQDTKSRKCGPVFCKSVSAFT